MPTIKVPVYGDVFFPDDMSDEDIANAIQNQLKLGPPREYSPVEAFVRGAEREAMGIYETIADWLSPVVQQPGAVVQEDWLGTADEQAGVATDTPLKSIVTPEESVEERSLRREIEARVAAEQNPVSGVLGRIGGGATASPLATLPLAAATVRGGAALGGLVGAAEGALSPTYEQFGDPSKLTMAGIGGVLGAVLGGGGVAAGRALSRKFGQNTAEEATQAVDSAAVESATAAEKPRYRGTIDPETGGVVYREVTPTDVIDEVPIPAPTVGQDVAQVQQNFVDVQQLPKLPNYLQGAKPRFAKSELAFETDLDRALYIVGNPTTQSARHKEYLDFLVSALNKPENEVLDLAKQVRREVIDAGKNAQKQAGLKGQDVAQINFKVSKTVDNLINPIDKHLDDISKLVYNYGSEIPVTPSGKVIMRAGDQRVQDLTQIMQGINSSYTSQDAAMAARGYSMMLKKLKEVDGRNFTARSFEDFVSNKELNNDLMIKLYNAGEFDGC